MNGAVICGDVLYARNHLSIKMSVGIVLLFMRVYVLTAAQGCMVMGMAETLRFEKIAGDGPDALYDLYIQGEAAGKALTLEEVLEEISRREEVEK